MATKIANPGKGYNYSIEIAGFDQALAQSIDLGEHERTANLHGEGERDIKTPGRRKVPDIPIEKLVPAEGGDNFFWNWFKQPSTSKASAVKKDFIIKHTDELGNIISMWQVEGAWVLKYKPGKLGDKEDDNLLETATLSCDECNKIM